MSTIVLVIVNTLLALCVIFLEFSLYSVYGRSWVPMSLGAGLGAAVLVISGLALYESIKHRGDKEPW